MMWVRMKFGREEWVFLSVYAPGTERGEDERDVFWEDLNEVLERFDPRVNVVLMGDMNARVGDECVEGVVGRWGVPGRNESGERLLEVCMEKELVIGNTWFRKEERNKYTWVRVANGRVVERACMDFIIVTKRVAGRLIDVHVYRGVAGGVSDHFLVEGKLRVRWGRGGERPNRSVREVIKVEELQKREKRVEYEERIYGEWERVKDSQAQDVEEEWGKFKKSILSVAREVCGVRKVGGGVRKGAEWWNEECRVAVEEKKSAYGRWLQVRDEDGYERYKEKRSRARRVIREAKREADVRWGERLSRDVQENGKMLWKEVKRLKKEGSGSERRVKGENGQVIEEEKEVRMRWKRHFEELLNVTGEGEVDVVAVGRERPMGMMGRMNEGRINAEEVRRAVSEMKSGKAAGLDECRVECLKCGGEAMIEWLVRLLNLCFEKGRVPVEWKDACIVPLYKGKGDRAECGNYRGISLLSVVGKVYGRVLIGRIRKGTGGSIDDVQGSFRCGRSCVDQIFAVRQLCEKTIGKGKVVYMAFMDLEKAYDRVDREALWKVLYMYGVGGRLLHAVKSMYEGGRACVRVGSEVSEWFDVKVGVRQGCVMSPWLFNVYMDGVVREVYARTRGVGVNLLNEAGERWVLSMLLFADDTVLVADSEEKLQCLVTEFGRVCKRRKLKVNVGKSKVLRCSNEGACGRMHIQLEGEEMEQVGAFKYLGSHIAEDGSMDVEVNHRVKEAGKMLGGMKQVWKKREVGINVKKKLYECCAVPTTVYGAETWSMKAGDKRKLNVFEMKCLRSMCGVTRWDRLRNEEVRRRTGVYRELGAKVEQMGLKWFGHMERMEEGRLTKQVMKAEVEGRRPRGRPRLGWNETVKMSLSARGVSMEEARVSAQDRGAWREIVNR